jgi:hypothetical protein
MVPSCAPDRGGIAGGSQIDKPVTIAAARESPGGFLANLVRSALHWREARTPGFGSHHLPPPGRRHTVNPTRYSLPTMHPTAELFTEKAWAAVVAAQQLAQQKRKQQMETISKV